VPQSFTCWIIFFFKRLQIQMAKEAGPCLRLHLMSTV